MKLPVRYHGEIVAWAEIDDDDAHLTRYRWGLDRGGYVCRTRRVAGRTVSILLHREVLGLPAGAAGTPRGDRIEADHKNNDTLDNRRANLQVLTHAENVKRKLPYRGGQSAHRGVSPTKSGTWRARLTIEGRVRSLGHYTTEEEAAAVVQEAWDSIHAAA